MVNITKEIGALVREGGLASGVCHVFMPHTTCGLAINENADPDVKSDINSALDYSVPKDFPYKHREGNSPAHVKSVLVGSSLTVFVEDSTLELGTWQGVFLCEYDGPRIREVWLRLIKG